MNDLTISIFGNKIFLEIMNESKLFSNYQTIHYDDLDLCIKDAITYSHLVLFFVNQSNKNDTLKIFGQPATKGMTDNNLWIYIERTQTRGKLLKLGRNYLKKNNVLVISFDTYGIVNKKEFYDKNNINSKSQTYSRNT